MKLPISCHKCSTENSLGLGSVTWVEFRDDSYYEFTCSEGHKTVTILQDQKFEVLFEIGAFAIKDGYYREAVSSFSSSLERFYEFAIKIFLLKQKIDIKLINKTWKLVSSQSERQLGAFIFLYTREFGIPPKILDSSKVQFRNSVIHKGKIPNKEEALAFGQHVLDICRPLINIIQTEYHDEMMMAIFHHLNDCRKSNNNSEPVSTLGIPTILSLTTTDPKHN